MSYIVTDVEADGEIPHKYSMVCFGAIIVEPTLSKTFYGETKPISELWLPDALAVSGFSREQHMAFDDPAIVMPKFRDWILKEAKPPYIFISDNLAFDWQWINYYFHMYGQPFDMKKNGKIVKTHNPFGFSGRRIGDLYAGLHKDTFIKWKHLRKTKHTHHPVMDAKGNAEVILHMRDDLGLKIKLE